MKVVRRCQSFQLYWGCPTLVARFFERQGGNTFTGSGWYYCTFTSLSLLTLLPLLSIAKKSNVCVPSGKVILPTNRDPATLNFFTPSIHNSMRATEFVV